MESAIHRSTRIVSENDFDRAREPARDRDRFVSVPRCERIMYRGHDVVAVNRDARLVRPEYQRRRRPWQREMTRGWEVRRLSLERQKRENPSIVRTYVGACVPRTSNDRQ